MAKIRVQRLKDSPSIKFTPKQAADRTCARLCYYYPSYTLAQARRLPAKDVRLLLATAQREKYSEYWWQTQIIAGPHTENGDGVGQLLEFFSERFS